MDPSDRLEHDYPPNLLFGHFNRNFLCLAPDRTRRPHQRGLNVEPSALLIQHTSGHRRCHHKLRSNASRSQSANG